MRLRSLLRWVVLCSWLMLGAGRLAAQPANLTLEFQHIQEAQGLSNNVVNCLMQDRDGYLWIGTYGGLNRYDGTHFTVFKTDRQRPTSLGNNIVHAMCQDKTGAIWVATDDGISRYDSRTGQFYNHKIVGNKALGQCLAILCDRQGGIWFSSANRGLFFLDPRTNQFTSFSHNPADPTSISSNAITKNGLLEDPHSNGLWLTSEKDGLNYLDIKSGQFLNHRNNPDQLPIFAHHHTSALALDGTNRLIFSDNTDERVLVYNLTEKKLTNRIPLASRTGRSAFPLGTTFVDRSHNLWVSSWTYTMFYIDANQYKPQEFFHDVAQKTSIASDFFWTGWQQNDGTIWFGTVSGLSYTNPGKTFYQIHNLARQHPDLVNGLGLTSFLEDDNGSWWLLSADNELFNYDPVASRLTTYPLPITEPNQYRFGLPMMVPGRTTDELIICRTKSLVLFNKRTRTFSSFPLPPLVETHARDFSTLIRRGDWLWLFGTSDVVFRYHLPSGQWRTFDLPVETGKTKIRVCSASFDKNGTLWADLDGKGFIWFSARQQRFMTYARQLHTTGFTDHFAFGVDAKNRLWLPVSGSGLVEFDPARASFRTWTEQDGLCSNECKSAFVDVYGDIWMGSFNKFSIINPAQSSVQNITLSLNESTIGYVNYMFPLRNGNLLTTLKNYVVEFMPRRINSQPTPTSVLISALTLPDTAISIHGRNPLVKLRVSENNFSISYSVLNRAQQTYVYFYTLDGYDDHWVKADTRTIANYTKIPGGDYTFRVKAVAGKTETAETRLTIHVNSAFYNTRWFRAGLLVLILTLTYLVYRYRVRQTSRLHHFQIQTTRLERDKAQIQYQNLINHLNPHFLFNSLTSLNSLILINPKDASVFLRKLSAIYRYILQNKDKELVSLQDELTFAQSYIELQKARFGDGLLIEINVDAAYLTWQIVPVTIQNLLENSIKHNIIDDESPLQIRIYTENATLVVRNSLQKKEFVETSNKQGLASLKSLYGYLSGQEISVTETATHFSVAVPLI